MKDTIQELADTKDTTTATDSISNLQGKVWLKKILEAAKRRMVFAQFAYETDLPGGTKDLALPIYTSNITDWVAQSGATGEGVARTMTAIDNLTTVTFTPKTYRYGCAISTDVVRTSQVDVVRHAREQLSYYAAYSVESAIETVIEAASAPNEVVCGGGATVAAGNTLDPDALAEGLRKMRANSWFSEPARPFILVIPAICEEALMKDSQFVNASEYGDQSIVLNGEIGKYLGIKIVVTNNVDAKSASDSGWNTDAHVCLLVKSGKCAGVAWSQDPQLRIVDNPRYLSKELILYMVYKAKVVYDDAIVRINVADAV